MVTARVHKGPRKAFVAFRKKSLTCILILHERSQLKKDIKERSKSKGGYNIQWGKDSLFNK